MTKPHRPRTRRPGWTGAMRNAALGALALLIVVILLELLTGTVLLGVGTVTPWIAAGLAVFLLVQAVLFRWLGLNSAADRVRDEEAAAADAEAGDAEAADADGESDTAREATRSAKEEDADWRAWRG